MNDPPDGEFDVLRTLRMVLRYRKRNRTRLYGLTTCNGRTELWVVVEQRGRILKSRRLAAFDDPEDISPFVAVIEQELRAGGWLPL